MNAINVSGSGNAVTSITKSGKTVSFVKGATFLTSHQSLAGYATESWVKGLKYITDADAAAKYQPKGNYLTSHQSLADYAKKTDIPVVPTKVSAFVNDANYLTAHQSLDGYVNAVTTTGTGNAVTGITKSGKTVMVTKGANFLTSHQDISGKSDTTHTHSVKINGVTKTIAATGGTPVDLGNYLTSHQSLAGYATESWVKGLKYITDADAAAKYQLKGNYLTSHQSLAGYAKTSQIPTKVSQLTNDSGFLTSHQSLAAYLKTADADKKYLGKTEKAASASTADNASKVNGHTVYANVPSNAKFTDTEYVIPTLEFAPTSDTLTFTDNGRIRPFKVGYMCRVADSSAEHGYKFYQLYNISGPNAVWGEIAGGDYNETVTVILKSTASSSDSKLNGAVVTVKNTMSGETQTQTWKGTPLVFKIPSVNTYTVSVSSISEYAAPVSQSYTAGISTSRNVIMTYSNLPLGIYIYDTDGHFTLSENWDTANNSKVVGVYVGTENSKFIIALTSPDETYSWGDSVQVSGIVTSTNQENAMKDYAGKLNTEKIIARLGTEAAAAAYCRNYIFKNGNIGYLWSLGEAKEACNNISKINKAFATIGSTQFAGGLYWTSTQGDKDNAWALNVLYDRIGFYDKVAIYRVRAVCSI